MHSRTEKTFSLPSPHPKGQQFTVRCRVCRRVYTVVTPGGWTNPWYKSGCILHEGSMNPVRMHDGKWWSWDEVTSKEQGPFDSETLALDAYNESRKALAYRMKSF